MTDERTRNLERAVAQGDVDAEAKLLLERVRSGDLTGDMLRLAGYLSHPAAVLALGDEAPMHGEQEGTPAFVLGLEDYGRESWLRAAWTSMELHAQHLREVIDGADDRVTEFKVGRHLDLLRRGLGLLGAWLVKPTEDTEADLRGWTELYPPFDRIGFSMRAARDATAGFSALPQVEVRSAIRAELLPWCLGTGDPVRDRVMAREREAAD